MAALALMAGTVTLGPAVAQAPAPRPKPAVEATRLPPLPSSAPPVARPEVPAGKFSYVPGPEAAAMGPPKAPKESSFDRARSTALDDQTTATRKVWRNADGTFTTQVDAHPLRHLEGGKWVDDDLTLSVGADGQLHAKAAPAAARLGPTAVGPVATVDTPAGPLSLRHPGALPVPAVATGATARYPRALAKGQDLALRATAEGFEETVSLPDRSAGPSYSEELLLPAGLRARAGGGGIEIIDAAGAVIGTYAGGSATDASFPASGADAMTPVAVSLGGVRPGDATRPGEAAGTSVVTVAVDIDPAWLASGARRFPVVIDPTYFRQTSATGGSDTFVSSGANAATSWWSDPSLLVGSANGTQQQRSYVRFDLTGIPAGPDVWVSNATLWLGNYYSPTCTAATINLYQLQGPFSAATTWNNRPTPEATTVASSASPPALGATGCPTNWIQLPATSIAQDWLRNGATNNGIELRAAAETDPANFRGFYSANSGSSVAPSLYVTWNHQPPPAAPASPADGAQLPSSSPTLSVTPVVDADGDTVQYWFRASNRPNAEHGYQAANSGWITTPSYTVPPGTLTDGETYWWHVYTWAGEPGTSPNPDPTVVPATPPTAAPRSFTVRLDLGASASQPSDQAGPVAVNLVSGNVTAGFGGARVGGIGGPVGVAYAYNAQGLAGSGLVGSYYNDPTGSGDFVGKSPAMVRTDPNLAFNWVGDGPGAAIASSNYLVRWDGFLTAPAGTYTLSVAHHDGIRITVNAGVVLDRWNELGATSSALSNSFVLPVGPVALKVELRTGTAPGGVLLGIFGTGVNGIIVPPSWLSAEPPTLPRGWSVGAGGYVSARMAEGSAVLTDVSGRAHTWTWADGGFTPPPGEFARLARDASGALTVHDGGGISRAFDTAGRLASATTATDDREPASALYVWGGTPTRLQTITDQVSGRVVTLHYATTATDAACPTLAGARAPVGMLCTVDHWDLTQTQLLYNASGQLARIVEPGAAVTDLGYNGDGLLNRIRDPLAADAVANSFALDDDTTRTVVTYTGFRGTRVVGPKPTATTLAPGRSYAYATSSTTVSIDGLLPAPHFARTVGFDSSGRLTSDTDATGHSVTATWTGEGDQPASATDAAGRRTTWLYDDEGNLTDTYGPAPAICFNSAGIPAGSCGAPHTATVYDGGIAGLAATYWLDASPGPPKLHDTVASAGGNVGADWAARPPATALGTTAWSVRLIGEVIFGSSTSYDFSLAGSGPRALWVDDALVANGTAVAGAAGSRHRVMIETVGSASPALELDWRPSGAGSYVAVPGTNLSPAYGLPTTTTVDDATAGSPPRVTATAYARPERGQPTAVTVDPGGANLTTTVAYEAPGTDLFARALSRTLPGGDPANAATATTYAYYGRAEARLNPCPDGIVANQGGQLKSSTGPTAAGGPGRTTEHIYDAAGRVVATRVGTEDWTCAKYDDPRGRPTSVAVPATLAGTTARAVTYAWAVGNDPRITTVADGTPGTAAITTTTDLLGRPTSYSDAWGNASTSVYDQPGRRTDTTGKAGPMHFTYDDSGRLLTQGLDGATVATPTYDAAGELATVAYANGTDLSAIARDPAGRATGLTFTKSGTLVTSDAVVRSQAGRVVTATTDGASSPTSTFTYDAPGRLVAATVPGHSLAYGFAASGGCGLATAAGKNTNRTSVSDNGATPITSCYDGADRLSSSSDPAVGTPTYDAHGNTKTLGAQTLGYDQSDRHSSTVAGSTTVTYVRDATDRIISRTEGASTVRYGFTGPGDSPAFTTDPTNLVVYDRSVALVGGVSVTKRLLTEVWGYPNLHGDMVATTDASGTKQGPTLAYDPFGQALTTPGLANPDGVPDNSAGNFDYGWLGRHQRPLEHAPGITTVEMGARPYVPGMGRFLEVDPVEGGSANDYDYTNADPLNQFDVNGTEAGGCYTFRSDPRADAYGAVTGYGFVTCTPNTFITELEICIQTRDSGSRKWYNVNCTKRRADVDPTVFDSGFVDIGVSVPGEVGRPYRTWIRSRKIFEGRQRTKTKTSPTFVYRGRIDAPGGID